MKGYQYTGSQAALYEVVYTLIVYVPKVHMYAANININIIYDKHKYDLQQT